MMSTEIRPAQKVRAWVNSAVGSMLAVVVRDVTNEDYAQGGACIPGEQLFEVRYIGGPYAGQYVVWPARYLQVVQ